MCFLAINKHQMTSIYDKFCTAKVQREIWILNKSMLHIIETEIYVLSVLRIISNLKFYQITAKLFNLKIQELFQYLLFIFDLVHKIYFLIFMVA